MSLFEISLVNLRLRPKLREKYLLRVAYEALVVTLADEQKTPVSYFKYQDIICWGSTSSMFQFKVMCFAALSPLDLGTLRLALIPPGAPGVWSGDGPRRASSGGLCNAAG